MTQNRKGILLMIAAVAAFAVQDGFSRHLAGNYNTLMVVMLRYWVFAAFVIMLALRRPEGARTAVQSNRNCGAMPRLQTIRRKTESQA